MLTLIVTTFHHLQHGLQTIIEDYIHQDAIRWAALMANKAVCTLVGLICVISALKIGL
jgi:succinate dehydrogenase / fumarate reductase membrane anchor subunit